MTADDQLLTTALRDRLGTDAARALLAKASGFSNYPNTVKGMARAPSAPEVEAAALAIVEVPELAAVLGLAGPVGLAAAAGHVGPSPTQELWALLTLAARADLAVVERMAERVGEREYAHKLLASIRRAATKHASGVAAAPAAEPATAGGPDRPQKVSEVKAWLAAHPDPDPALLAPVPGQKAAARVAAVRALATIGTTDALAVLGGYADDVYPDALLAELHKAWGRFDRRAFAATMFRSGRSILALGLAPTIEGIGAVAGLTDLDVVLTDGADLSPLAECTGLRTLRVGAEGEPGLLGVEPLTGLAELSELHLTRTTRHADLTPLAGLGVQRLRIDLDDADGSFLLRMARLERLLLSAGAGSPGLANVVLALVRNGVRVVTYRHQRGWVDALAAQAEAAADVFTAESGGYLGLTRDESGVEPLRRSLFSNLVP